MTNEWCVELMRCAEGMYVLNEKSKEIVWANPYFTEGLKRPAWVRPAGRRFWGGRPNVLSVPGSPNRMASMLGTIMSRRADAG